MLKLVNVVLKGNLSKNIRNATKGQDSFDPDGETFLCRDGYKKFVSNIQYLGKPDHSMPANDNNGRCIYVQGPSRCIPIDELDEMYYIVESNKLE